MTELGAERATSPPFFQGDTVGDTLGDTVSPSLGPASRLHAGSCLLVPSWNDGSFEPDF